LLKYREDSQMKNRRYTADFKDSAVQLVMDTDKSILEIAT
jgi:transposase-like protein